MVLHFSFWDWLFNYKSFSFFFFQNAFSVLIFFLLFCGKFQGNSIFYILIRVCYLLDKAWSFCWLVSSACHATLFIRFICLAFFSANPPFFSSHLSPRPSEGGNEWIWCVSILRKGPQGTHSMWRQKDNQKSQSMGRCCTTLQNSCQRPCPHIFRHQHGSLKFFVSIKLVTEEHLPRSH